MTSSSASHDALAGRSFADRPTGAEFDGASRQRRLVFSLDRHSDCLYACLAQSLSEVIAAPKILKIPRTKPWFLGLCGHRGHPITVNDLHAYLFSATCDADAIAVANKSSRILVFDYADFLYGFLVANVVGFRDFIVEKPPRVEPAVHKQDSDQLCLHELKLVGGPLSADTESSQCRFLGIDFESLVASRQFRQPGLGLAENGL
ncbi:MAG: chemotaxis protein CheW [Gammaproteobacteria bacterium]|nr:chemotaxis protein CheW [Gammaproteobacteria bacterium]